jgi:phenylpropionate dioxygenase-like ring-hydroxylating dioxygenase large terminal subunit
MQFEKLIQQDRVHRRVYTDAEVFEAELARVFGRAWLYVGHESQVPRPGDFFVTRLGRQPVIVVRHSDGAIHVLHNRCAHRGPKVVSVESGNAGEFRCCYHGWTYATDGRLLSAPYAKDNFGTHDLDPQRYGLAPVARVESYRGFLFASLAKDGPDLRAFLGPLAASFDDLVDRGPDGVEVAGGVFKHYYDGNWKLYIENIIDPTHPLFVHESSIEAGRGQQDVGSGAGEIARRQMMQNGEVWRLYEKPTVFAFPHGHAFMGDYHSDAKLLAGHGDPKFAPYRAALAARVGEERANKILSVQLFNSVVYPNLSFMSQFRQLRVVHPISVDRTEVWIYSFRLKGAPEEMFHETVYFANAINSPASPILTDDLETYRRQRDGLISEGRDWVLLARGAGADQQIPGGLAGNTGATEVALRAQFKAWAAYMADEA